MAKGESSLIVQHEAGVPREEALISVPHGLLEGVDGQSS